MARALCTIASDSYGELLDLTRPTLEEYADRHGFELIVGATPNTELPATWEKVQLTRALLDAFSEVLWIDSDAIIVDPSRDVFAEMAPDRGLGLVMHVAHNLLPNAGVLALRSQLTVRSLLDDVWSARDDYATHIWGEQAALCKALGFASHGDGRLHLVRPTAYMLATEFLNVAWNSIPVDRSWTPYIKHYPSLPHEERLQAMRRDSHLLAERRAAPAYEVAFVCVTHGSTDAELAQLQSAITAFPQTESVQLVLITPADWRTDWELPGTRADVKIVSADGPPDSLLLQALPFISAKVLISADRAVPVSPALISATASVLSSRDDIALRHKLSKAEILSFHRHHLPVTGWMSNPATARRTVLEPAMLALQGNDIQIVQPG